MSGDELQALDQSCVCPYTQTSNSAPLSAVSHTENHVEPCYLFKLPETEANSFTFTLSALQLSPPSSDAKGYTLCALM